MYGKGIRARRRRRRANEIETFSISSSWEWMRVSASQAGFSVSLLFSISVGRQCLFIYLKPGIFVFRFPAARLCLCAAYYLPVCDTMCECVAEVYLPLGQNAWTTEWINASEVNCRRLVCVCRKTNETKRHTKNGYFRKWNKNEMPPNSSPSQHFEHILIVIVASIAPSHQCVAHLFRRHVFYGRSDCY